MATVLGLVLRLYQMMRPGFLLGVTEYDDGVYFGSAVRLVHGIVPYRDYVLVQPPGITVLMAPLAWLSSATGTDTALAVGRVLTACAGAAAVPLAGLLVRSKGLLATTVACGVLAVYPAGINAAHTVLLEPWVTLFCLLGMIAVFDGDQIASSRRRLAWGGAAFGVAAAIKLWALIPVVVLLVIGARRMRGRAWRAYLGGFAGAFAVVVGPFFVLAPRAFYHDVVVAQVSRVDLTRLSEWDRLASLTGLSAFAPVARGVIIAVAAAIAGFVLVCAAGASVRDRRSPAAVERFALLTAALVLVAFLWPPDYYLHYAWFFAPFLALSMALAAARLTSPWRGPLVPLLLGVAAVIATVMTVVQVRQEARLTAEQPRVSADRQIPAGACVLTDISSLTISADRFVSSQPGCATLVDAIGTDYALSRGQNGVTGAGRTPALQALWLSAFDHAQYVWLACAPSSGPQCLTNRRIPWTPAIRAYFSAHFSPDHRAGAPANLYLRRPGQRHPAVHLLASSPM